jgi:hypothetical protein
LYVLELESCSVTEPKGLPGDAVVASGPAWAPASFGKESDQIVCAAWLGDITNFKSTSRRLGLVFCFNRPSALFLVSAPLPERAKTELNADDTKSAVLLTKDVPSALWPRFSPDGKKLAYVSHERAVVTGAHAATCALRVMDWTKEGKPSRDVLGVETKKKRGAFPGLYASAPLVADPWLGNDALVVQTTWGAGEAIVRVDVNSGEVTRLTPPAAEGEGDWIGGSGSRKGDEEKAISTNEKRKPFLEPGGSWALADVKRGVVAAVRSDPGSPPEARVCFIGESSLETRASFAGWHAVTRSVASPAARRAAAALEKLEYFAQDVSRSVSDGAYLLTSADADEDLDAFGDATVVQSIVVRVKRDDTSPTLTDTDDKKAASDYTSARGPARRVHGDVRHLGGVPRQPRVRRGVLQLPREHRVRRVRAAEPGGRRGRRRGRARRHGLLRDCAAVHKRRHMRPGSRVRGGRVARGLPGRATWSVRALCSRRSAWTSSAPCFATR